jgi:hypothetical protein
MKYLSHFGKSYHIHSRFPPQRLTYTGSIHTTTENAFHFEAFNDVPIPEKEVENYTVIFIYRDPVKAIYSSFIDTTSYPGYVGCCIDHLKHIGCREIHLSEIAAKKTDLYGIEEFFDQYTQLPLSQENARNYAIYCVKYEDFYENLSRFNETVGIPDVPDLYPEKREKTRIPYCKEILEKIYRPLKDKMGAMGFIEKR